MKRLTLALSTMLLVASAYAQQPPGPPRGGAPVEMLAQQLGLTDAQKTEVKRILDEERTRHEAERAQYAASGQRPDPATMKTIIAQHDSELTSALANVLSADQLAKFKAMQAERREHMRGPPPGAPSAQ